MDRPVFTKTLAGTMIIVREPGDLPLCLHVTTPLAFDVKRNADDAQTKDTAYVQIEKLPRELRTKVREAIRKIDAEADKAPAPAPKAAAPDGDANPEE